MRTLARDAAALLLYPGLLTVALTGLLGELAQGAITRSAGAAAEALRPLVRRPPTTAIAAAALGGLAAVQLTAPYSPLDSGDRNLLVAVFATAAVAWLAWAWEPAQDGGRLFIALAGWLVALLIPAVLAQDLRPQALGSLAVDALLPAKAAAAALYLLALPAIVGLLGRGRPAPQRIWLWLPSAGLFPSVFLPPAGDDAAGLLRFFAVAASVTLLTLVLGRVLRGPRPERLHAYAVAAVAAVAVLLTGIAISR